MHDAGDLKTHGCGETGDQGYLSKNPDWLCAYVDRVERMLIQNKNEAYVENGLAVLKSIGKIFPEAKYYGFDTELTYYIFCHGRRCTDSEVIPAVRMLRNAISCIHMHLSLLLRFQQHWRMRQL